MMNSGDEILDVANKLLTPKGLKVTSYEILQNLWAGYGHIARLQTVPIGGKEVSKPEERHSKNQSLILKVVTPPDQNDRKKQQVDEGHLRKLISYQVEQYFYTHFATQLSPEIAPVAKSIASINESGSAGVPTIAVVLTDLRDAYLVEGEKRGELNETQVYAALKWLAGFHGFWWQRVESMDRQKLRLPPLEEAQLGEMQRRRDGLWLNGGYTYLATRQKEYNALQRDQNSEWSSALCIPVSGSKTGQSIADLVAQILSPSSTSSPSSPTHKYETIIHGDVKSENLFTNSAGTEVAFFDFQYVGLGLGVCDLAKLFTCSVPMSLLASSRVPSHLDIEEGERNLLEYYRKTVETISGMDYPFDLLLMHWKTALVDWLRFQASWGFWGNTDWLEARVRHILRDREWIEWATRAGEQKS